MQHTTSNIRQESTGGTDRVLDESSVEAKSTVANNYQEEMQHTTSGTDRVSDESGVDAIKL